MESLKKLREPVAVVALVALGLRVLLALVSAGVYAGDDVLRTFARAAGPLAYRVGDPALVLLLAAALLACGLFDRTPNVKPLTVAGLVTIGATVGVTVVFLVVGSTVAGPTRVVDTLTGLLQLVVPVLVGVVLLRQLTVLPSARTASAPAALAPAPPEVRDQPAQPPAFQPTWQPDAAAGAAWHTAGDAASGAPAAGWGTPGQSGGWDPIPAPPSTAPGTGPGESRPAAPPSWPPNRT